MKPDLVLELAIAPAAALTRLSGAINRKRQRADLRSFVEGLFADVPRI